jgi:hypothetical protein
MISIPLDSVNETRHYNTSSNHTLRFPRHVPDHPT